MTITCPHCAFGMEITGARPGRFSPACPNCHRRFLLTLDDSLAAAVAPLQDAPPPAQTFGQYALVRKIADGATGSVYQARDLTLNRDVALKVFTPALSHDSGALEEARRAAALSHPNIVTVYDTGRADNTAYIAYEYLPGPSLADVLLRQGPLPPRQAAMFTRQTAGALQAIHAAGLHHKDVKPANLLLAGESAVKLTDLGPTAGSPAYMAPEQITGSALSNKTDVYNLGATFYELLTGRPPFAGGGEQEILSQHLTAPLTPPDVINAAVPPALARLAVRMLAKAPEDRPSVAEVIDALDAYLATDTSPAAPERMRAIELLETAVERYNHAPLARLRPRLIGAFYAACALLIVLAALLHSATWAGGWTAFAVLMTASYLLLAGVSGQSPIPAKLRELAFTATPKQWLWRLGVAAVLLLVVYLLDVYWLWLTFAVAAGAIAAAFHFTIDAMLARERREPVEQVRLLLKSMRLKGEPEESIREFVYANAGPEWEPFYEALFGYDAKMQARRKLAASGQLGARRKSAPWRDPVIAWIDTRLEYRRGQVAERVATAKDAPRSPRAELVAVQRKPNDLLVPPMPQRPQASNAQSAVPQPPVQVQVFAAPPAPPAEPPKSKRVVYGDEDESGRRRPRRRSYLEARYGSPLALLVGPHVRLLLSLPLLLGFALWAHQNNKAPDLAGAKATITKTLSSVTGERPADGSAATQPANAPATAPATAATAPLELAGVPGFITHLFYDYRPGLAGVLLLLGAFSASTRLGLLLIPAAGIIFFAPLIPFPGVVAFPRETAGTIVGGALALLAFLFPGN